MVGFGAKFFPSDERNGKYNDKESMSCRLFNVDIKFYRIMKSHNTDFSLNYLMPTFWQPSLLSKVLTLKFNFDSNWYGTLHL